MTCHIACVTCRERYLKRVKAKPPQFGYLDMNGGADACLAKKSSRILVTGDELEAKATS